MSVHPLPLPAVHLRLHAYPAVTVGGTPAPLRLKRALALLALLAEQAGQPVGRQELAALLWPDADATTGRGRLRRLVHELHGALRRDLVQGDNDALWLPAGCASDLRSTRAAIDTVLMAPAAAPAAAVAALLQPGSDGLLAGFELDAEGFADWLAHRRREHQARLQRALERVAGQALADGDAELADSVAARLLQLDPCAESGHAARMGASARRGDAAALENAYHEAATRLRDELGVRPSARLEAAYAGAGALLRTLHPPLDIRYVDTGQGEVACASWGRGPQTLVMLWGMVSNLEVALEEPRARALLDRLAQRHRVVMLDRRGTGLSERVGVVPDAANAARDIVATLDHLGVQRAWLFGTSVGGTLALDFALRHPERSAGLLLYGTNACGTWAPDWPWSLRAEDVERWVASLTDPAHYDHSLRRFAPSAADDPAMQAWYARLLRNAATRRGTAASLRAYLAMDLRPQLHRLRLPALVLHRRGDRAVPLAAGQRLAAAIPGAHFEALDGVDHFHWVGDGERVLRSIERFVQAHARARTLAA